VNAAVAMAGAPTFSFASSIWCAGDDTTVDGCPEDTAHTWFLDSETPKRGRTLKCLPLEISKCVVFFFRTAQDSAYFIDIEEKIRCTKYKPAKRPRSV
jgi:hypothetical protein